LYDEFIGFKQSVLYGGGNSNPSKESHFMLPDGREKPILMTLQALKHEEVRALVPLSLSLVCRERCHRRND
jgi:hypothetical protein